MSGLREEVEAIVSKIPKGRVMTYGQIAALAGYPRAARAVGGVAHYGDVNISWHRVVNQRGRLAIGYPGGRRAQGRALRAEGVGVSSDYYVPVKKLLWWPS